MPRTSSWDRVIQVVGLGAALAAWIAVVGGGKTWARLESADIPATHALAGLPRELMVAEGLQTLLVPILIGAGAAVLVPALARPREDEAGSERSGLKEARKVIVARYGGEAALGLAALAGVVLLLIVVAIAEVDPLIVGVASIVAVGTWILGVSVLSWERAHIVAILVALGGVAVAFADALALWAIAAMVALTVAATWLTLVFVARADPPKVAVTLFAAFALWAGALGFVQEAGDKTPRLEEVAVTLEGGGDPELGYYLGHGSGRLYLAQETQGADAGEGDPVRHVLVLQDEDIERVVYGKEELLPETGDAAAERQQTGAGPGDELGGADPTGGPTPVPEGPPLPPLQLMAPKNRVAGTLDGVRAELQILSLVRRDRILELDARLVNVSDSRGEPGPLRIGDALDDMDSTNEPFTVDKLTLIDPRAREVLPVYYDDEGHCACTQGLDRADLDPGEGWRLWAAFPVPGDDLSEADLAAPGFGWIRGVEVE